MDNLLELQRRKAALKAQIEQQRGDLKKTVLEIREEIEPTTLLRKALSGMFSFSKNKPNDAASGVQDRLPPALSFMADLFIRDPRMALAVKLLAPLALKVFPKSTKTKALEPASDTPLKIPKKSNIYGSLRQGISRLRGRLKKTADELEKVSEPTEQ